jgi:hypothetical protein
MWMCDLYRSVLDCCEFIYPRLTRGRLSTITVFAVVLGRGARLTAIF